jgi:hypothetical protein
MAPSAMARDNVVRCMFNIPIILAPNDFVIYRRIRTRMSGGVGGGPREGAPYPDMQFRHYSEYCGIFIVSPSFIEDRCA